MVVQCETEAHVQHQAGDRTAVVREAALFNAESLERLLEMRIENQEASGLDPRTYSIVKIAGLVGMNGSAASFAWQIGMARDSGVTDSDISGILIALAPTIGTARLVAAASEIAAAIDVELEDDDESDAPRSLPDAS
jgi:hypothetical protein